MRQKRIISFLLALALILGLIMIPGTDANAAAKTKKLTLTKSLTLYVGGSKQLTLKADGKNVAKKAKWTTGNKKVITVKNGKVSAKAPGVVTVSAKYGGKTAKIKITVIGLSTTNLTLNAGQTKKLNVMNGKKAVTKGVTWSSSNASVVSVSDGTVTAKASGKAVITAKYKKKAFKCQVSVKASGGNTDPKNPEKKVEIKLSQTSVSVDSGSKVNLELYKGTEKVTDQAKWTTANADIATVSVSKRDDINKVPAYGVVLGQSNGSTTITALYEGKTYSCAVTVKNGFDIKNDLVISYGTKTIHIDFDLKTDGSGNPDPAEVAELEAQGCTVNGKNVQKDQLCETATYTFKKLPKTVVEIRSLFNSPEKNDTVDQQVPGAGLNYGGFNALAATVCAACTFDGTPDPRDPYKENDPVWDMFEYINGPAKSMDIARAQRQTAVNSMKDAYKISPNVYKSYFKGATSKNNYTPNVPYVLEMYKGPYYIPRKETITGTRPTTYMMFVSGRSKGGSDSFDSDVYIDVYYSTKDARWYSYANQFMHITSNKFKDLEEEL
ncbi:MAG: Ig-like domain-containing protein [Eubacterium sp.]|nr:Ig-like domain-containing protein [Eubacterium sp.]